MGRFYSGDIEGKFWVGIQDSNDVENLVTITPTEEYAWKACNCFAEVEFVAAVIDFVDIGLQLRQSLLTETL